MSETLVAESRDVPERGGLCVRVGEVEIGLFRVGDEFLAIENACPHAGHPLHEGELAGCVVTCPAHGFEYDLRTGYAVDHQDGFPIPRFEVSQRDGSLYIDCVRDDEGGVRPRAMRPGKKRG